MTNEEVVSNFLRTAYTDDKLAALLAHAEDGKLAFESCCCLIGIPTAHHALQPHREGIWEEPHLELARLEVAGRVAESAFERLAKTDRARRTKLIPLIRAEMARREAERITGVPKPELAHPV